MCACPGRTGLSAAGEMWCRDLSQDIAALESWRAERVVSLIEAHEFRELGVQGFAQEMRSTQFEWQHFPITNLMAPDCGATPDWAAQLAELSTVLDRGGRVVFHCAAGLGRTGTVAAALLVLAGYSSAVAIDAIRTARAGTIESAAQVKFLCALRAMRTH